MKTTNLYFSFLLLLLPIFAFSQVEEGKLLGQWDDPALVGSNTYDNTYNEIWGVARGGKEYAVLGSTAGTHFIDVTDPASPTEAFFIKGAESGGIIIHRDYHDFGDYLYAVADEGSSTLQIIDLSQLPDTVTVVYDDNDLFVQAHNIFIDEAGKRLYTFATSGGQNSYSAMRIYSLNNPLQPLYLAEYRVFGDIQASHVHDGYVENHVAYLHLGSRGFAIVDFTAWNDPKVLSTLTDYPGAGYNHSGWLSEDGGYYYLSDETHGSPMKVLDVRNPCEIEVVTTFDAGVTEANSIPHNQVVACDYLYVSYYYDGLQVYSLSNPAYPRRVLQYNTSELPRRRSYEGAWGVYPFLPSGNILVSDMQRGLFVLEGLGDGCENTAGSIHGEINTSCGLVNSTETILSSEDFKVFPQPAQDFLQVELNLTDKSDKVSIFLSDVTGRTVARFEDKNLNVGQNRFELALPKGMASGLYVLQLESDAWRGVRKVVVN